MDEMPLVSVLMTSYNREKYIGEAIKSVLDSTYKNLELIIVDDLSKDRTVEIANSFAKMDARIKVYVNEKNLGDYANRNKAATYSTGFYIMHVDSDDTIFQDGIEKCVAAMSNFPDSDFGILHYYVTEVQNANSVRIIRDHLFKIPYLGIGPGGTIIKRKFFFEIKGFPEKYGPANDMFFNLKAVSLTRPVLLPFEFHFYRRHEGQEINNHFSYIYNNYNYLQDALKELNLFVNEKEKKWLIKKNKRRLLVNIIKYWKQTYDIKRCKQLVKKTNFSFKDFMEAVFH